MTVTNRVDMPDGGTVTVGASLDIGFAFFGSDGSTFGFALDPQQIPGFGRVLGSKTISEVIKEIANIEAAGGSYRFGVGDLDILDASNWGSSGTFGFGYDSGRVEIMFNVPLHELRDAMNGGETPNLSSVTIAINGAVGGVTFQFDDEAIDGLMASIRELTIDDNQLSPREIIELLPPEAFEAIPPEVLDNLDADTREAIEQYLESVNNPPPDGEPDDGGAAGGAWSGGGGFFPQGGNAFGHGGGAWSGAGDFYPQGGGAWSGAGDFFPQGGFDFGGGGAAFGGRGGTFGEGSGGAWGQGGNAWNGGGRSWEDISVPGWTEPGDPPPDDNGDPAEEEEPEREAGGFRPPLVDPLVIDLDGDGIELTPLIGSQSYFDLDGDGFAEQTGWVGPDDGLLVLDRNANNFIDDIYELFGDTDGHAHGFSRLAELDTDGNGIINSSDAEFSELQVWIDRNTDGVSEASELYELAEIDIIEISLNYELVEELNEGHRVNYRGSASFADGTTAHVEDIFFERYTASSYKKLDESFVINERALLIPVLWASGNLESTWVALSQDENLLQEAETLLSEISTGDIAKFLLDFEGFLYNWADVQDISTSSRGQYVDGRKLAFLEALFGTEFEQQHRFLPIVYQDPDERAGAQIERQFADVVETLAIRFIAQSPTSHSLSLGGDFETLAANILSHPAFGLHLLADDLSPTSQQLSGDLGLALSYLDGNVQKGNISLGNAVRLVDLLAHEFAVYGEDFHDTIARAIEPYTTEDSELLSIISRFKGSDFDFGSENDDVIVAEHGFLPAYREYGAFIYGGAGDDHIISTINKDILYGGEGDDLLEGGRGADIYVFRRGDGSDTIRDTNSADLDTVVIYDYSLSELRVNFDGLDGRGLRIEFENSDDSIIVEDSFQSTNGRIVRSEHVEAFEVGNEAIISIDNLYSMAVMQQITTGNDVIATLEGFAHNDDIDGSSGNDEIRSYEGEDTLIGSVGDDTLVGGVDGDIYIYRSGDDQDVIHDQGSENGVDVVRIEGYSLADAKFTIDPDPTEIYERDNLLITFEGSADRLILVNSILSSSGVYSRADRIEAIEFDGGVVLDADAILEKIIADQITSNDDIVDGFRQRDDFIDAGAGNDSINADTGNDTLIGGAGNDILVGKSGSDTYLFAVGDGVDVIEDDGSLNDVDVLRFEGYEASDATFTLDSDDINDVLVSFGGNGDQIRLVDAILVNGGYSGRNQIDNIEFADGIVLDGEGIQDRILSDQTTAGDDIISGFANRADALNGGSGNDLLSADSGDDILVGGLGDDTLVGGRGDDLYIFSRGDGQDIVRDGGGLLDSDLVLIEGYTSEEARFSQDPELTTDVLITFEGTTDVIRLVDAAGQSSSYDRVERVEFADGVGLDAQSIRDRLLSDQISASDDSIVGTDSGDLIEARGGNDLILAGDGADTLIGDLGDDTLTGEDGDDTYIFRAGDGRDVIDDHGGAEDNDVLRIEDYASVDAMFHFDAGNLNDVLISFAQADDEIRLVYAITGNGGYSNWRQVDQIEFADGVLLDGDDVRERLLIDQATNGDDLIFGFANRDDLLDGGDGNDQLSGNTGNDTLRGGVGDDTMIGGEGADLYVFQRGDGHDTIVDEEAVSDGEDVLRIEGYTADEAVFTYDPNDGDDVLISFEGTDDTLRLVNAVGTSSDLDQIERIEFDGGVVLQVDDVRDRLLADQANDSDDNISGSNGADLLDGGGGDDSIEAGSGADTLIGGVGDDTLIGGDGTDTYVFRRGDGEDLVHDQGDAETDTLRIEGYTPDETRITFDPLDRDDILISFDGTADRLRLVDATSDFIGFFNDAGQIERIEFEDGTSLSSMDMRDRMVVDQTSDNDDVIYGIEYSSDMIDAKAGNDEVFADSGHDTIIGGVGNDTLIGGWGDDTYVFRRGDGQDLIHDQGYHLDEDILRIEGYVLGEARIIFDPNDANDVLISFGGADDSIRLVDATSRRNGDFDSSDRVGVIEFDGGAILDAESLRDRMILDQNTNDDDLVLGYFNRADWIEAGFGNDTLTGASGSDTYVFRRGDGQDVIHDQGGASDSDTLRIEGYLLEDLIFERDDKDAIVRFSGTDDSLLLVDAIAGTLGGFDSNDRIENLQIGEDDSQSLWSFYS
ncbi:calcium-binding protein [Pontivivens ytuae]|uniref:Haemolysin-type calcium binding-related domain-containing protein n=1 Tax=Pontivivens ytuae TaxID=2789856 RepID=A0A7S9QDR8_9RHOB|nr:calcium-binding protein [Pontivivens ytuae]QPH54667.1 hypothetical protein I0K15_02470 [Pontivivens ytuae]